jgi:hypothetical protein
MSTAQTDTQVTTVVQQIDAQGPAVVERISTQFADVACTPENARMLVDALHNGTAVTLSANGKTATFTPTSTHLGYGEAYIALALAAEALRNAGVTGCATPEQWQSVLLGGPLAAAGTTSTSTTRSASATSSSRFPGILALRSQGQGWGQIAQTTNVQLGQVVSGAHSSLNLSRSSDQMLSPTGRTSPTTTTPTTTPSRSSTKPHTSTDTSTTDKSTLPDQGKPKTKDIDENTDRDRSRSDSTSSPRPDR